MIGFHVQYQPDLTDLLATVKPEMMLYFQPADSVPYLAPITIGRMYYANQSDMLNTDPIAAGHAMAEDAIRLAHANGIHIWQGPNEPGVGDDVAIAKVCACEKERTSRLNAAGLQAAVFTFSVGWPREDMATRKLYTVPYDEFMRWLPAGNYVAFHEYWLPTGPLHPDSYDPLYPSKIWRFKHWPYSNPILITECGIDVQGQTSDGWKSHVPPGMNLEQWASIYNDQLMQYDSLVSQDYRVRGKVVFTVGGGFGWGSFDVLSHWQYFVKAFTYHPEVPVLQNPIRAKLASGTIVTLDMNEYLKDVVPSEMGARWLRVPDDPADIEGSYHTENTEEEALWCQAVLSRSYALWRRDVDPRSPDFDIYGDTRDQAYNPRRRHTRTSAIVEASINTYIADANGKPFAARYVSACGRSDCPWCCSKGGFGGQTWDGRVCQFGMQYMAKNGHKWQDVVSLYYGTAAIVVTK